MSENKEQQKRDRKGNNLLDFTGNFVALDLETTGFGMYNEIIEIAAIKVVGWRMVESFDTLVSPSNKKISSRITEITGITNDMVKAAPKIELLLPHFLEFVGDNLIVAHNANFDIDFIYDNCIKYLNRPFTNDFICTMNLARRVFSGSCSLDALVEKLKLGDKVEHRALPDCKHVVKLYRYLYKYMLDNNIKFNDISEWKIWKYLTGKIFLLTYPQSNPYLHKYKNLY